ncbi:MAG: hypothetical protein WC236_13280 [Gallionellaceae bacterium]|jgi:hypothetical protein
MPEPLHILFIPIKLEELKPGLTIYFPLSYASGEMAINAGLTPESEEQVTALVERGDAAASPIRMKNSRKRNRLNIASI